MDNVGSGSDTHNLNDPNQTVCFRLPNPDLSHVNYESTTLLWLGPSNVEFLEQGLVNELVKGPHHLETLTDKLRTVLTLQWFMGGVGV
jgi:hypothetical protein